MPTKLKLRGLENFLRSTERKLTSRGLCCCCGQPLKTAGMVKVSLSINYKQFRLCPICSMDFFKRELLFKHQRPKTDLIVFNELSIYDVKPQEHNR
jgi:hypothetical protein